MGRSLAWFPLQGSGLSSCAGDSFGYCMVSFKLNNIICSGNFPSSVSRFDRSMPDSNQLSYVISMSALLHLYFLFLIYSGRIQFRLAVDVLKEVMLIRAPDYYIFFLLHPLVFKSYIFFLSSTSL